MSEIVGMDQDKSPFTFRQIAVAVDPDYGECLYALGCDGLIYERASKRIGDSERKYWWSRVELPFTAPLTDAEREGGSHV
jgi:hypothetical protein